MVWDGLEGVVSWYGTANQGRTGTPFSPARHVPRSPRAHHPKLSDPHPRADPCTSIYLSCRIRAVHAVQSWISRLESIPPLRRAASRPLRIKGLAKRTAGRIWRGWRGPLRPLRHLDTAKLQRGGTHQGHPRDAIIITAVVSVRRRLLLGLGRAELPDDLLHTEMLLHASGVRRREHRTDGACCMKSASDVPLPCLALHPPTITPVVTISSLRSRDF